MEKRTQKTNFNGEKKGSHYNAKAGSKGLHLKSTGSASSASRKRNSQKARIEKQYHDIKKTGLNILKEGHQKWSEAQVMLSEYSTDLVKNVKTHPLSSVFIAGGIGFILSSLLRK